MPHPKGLPSQLVGIVCLPRICVEPGLSLLVEPGLSLLLVESSKVTILVAALLVWGLVNLVFFILGINACWDTILQKL